MYNGRRGLWRRRFDEALRPLGLTNGQFSLLMSLNRPKPAGMGSVASLLAMDRTTLTAALKPLERRGLVKMMADPDDRRSRLLALTPKGTKLLASAHADLGEHASGSWKRLLATATSRRISGRVCWRFL